MLTNIKNECIKLHNFLNLISRFYRECLLDNKEALEYLKNVRGWTEDTVNRLEIGYSESTNSVMEFALKHGFDKEMFLDSGIFLNRSKFLIYILDDRITFPLKGMDSNILGFSGRVFREGDDRAKFVNTSNSLVFSKSLALYNLDLAVSVEDNFIILTEGVPDVISFVQSGILNVVSPCGTALTEQQALILKFLNKKIFIIMDSDFAGKKSSMRIEGIFNTLNIPFVSLVLNHAKDSDEFIKKYGVQPILDSINSYN